MLNRIKLQTVKAMTRKNGTLSVRIVACKMYPGRQTAFDINLFWDNDRGLCVTGEEMIEFVGDKILHLPRTFENWYNSWAYYNTDSEQGYYAHYYINE